MRILDLSKSGTNKVGSRQVELKASDVEGSLKSFSPGEWCFLKVGTSTKLLVAFINPLIEEKFSSIFIAGECLESSRESFSITDLLYKKIKFALDARMRFKDYQFGCRAFYGSSDGLNGLIVDIYLNAVIVQINSAGLDKYRNEIKKIYEDLTRKETYLLDNQKYREKESLPQYQQQLVPDLEVKENNIKYKLRSEVLQKVGFYYDHRENRLCLKNLLTRLDIKPKRGLDLFCYTGAWGLHALSGGVDFVDFVDQGDFSIELSKALELNHFSDKGTFIRQDVFKFLDESIQNKKNYDVVLCDPPAFAKSASQKDQALDGYTKLHRKVLRVASPGSIVVFSSCTHYVNHEEFQKNILDAALKEGKKMQLLYCGIQGWDHPIVSLNERASYIKSYIYILE